MKTLELPEPVLIININWEEREYVKPPDSLSLYEDDFLLASRGEVWKGEFLGLFPRNKPAVELLSRRMQREYGVKKAPQKLWLARYEMQLDLPNAAQPAGLSLHLPRLVEVLYKVLNNPEDTDDLEGFYGILFADSHILLREKVNGIPVREIWFRRHHDRLKTRFSLRSA